MVREFETKVLDINVKEIEGKLLKIGAKKDPEFLMKRWVFDIGKNGEEWIRLRDDGKKITITYKYKAGNNIDETEEIELIVNNFQKAAEILSKIEFKGKYYQENKRIVFKLKGIEFCIDSWPKLPTYLEIESSNKEKVVQGLKMLGLQNKDVGNMLVKDVYSKYGFDLHSFKELKF